MKMKKLSPVLVVDEIEPVLSLWEERLGFERTVEVPHEDQLGFVILKRDAIEVMYQSRASVADDVPPLSDHPQGGAAIFIEVEDLDAIEGALEGLEPVVPRRRTFYGADELIVRDRAGNVVTFAEFGDAADA